MKPNKVSNGMDYDYEHDHYEDDYVYHDRHPQSDIPVSSTPAPALKDTPIRLWKVR